MKHYLVLYAATLIVMLAMDAMWLGVLSREFYKARLGDLLEFHFLPALLFYLLYVAGVLVFVSGKQDHWQSVALYGAFFGGLAYATYDLTNLATLRPWSVSLALVDIAWGIANTAFSATIGWWISRSL